MTPATGPIATAPSAPDGDGVRITRIETNGHRRWWLLLPIAALGLGLWWWRSEAAVTRPEAPALGSPAPVVTTPAESPATTEVRAMREAERPRIAPPPASSPATSSPNDWRTGDANDLATYVSPGDPEPSMAELIAALRAQGETGGLAAFNPPGTMPLLAGLAVPPDFVLPPGYVRHHQVTDEGEPIEAILMYAPDFVPLDAQGRPIAIPENRVVPPELAPPGLPLRNVQLPAEPEH